MALIVFKAKKSKVKGSKSYKFTKFASLFNYMMPKLNVHASIICKRIENKRFQKLNCVKLAF